MLPCCTCGCAPTTCWTKGFVGFLPVLRPPPGSSSASCGGFSSPMVPTLRDGVTPAGSRLVCPRSERRFRVTIWVRCVGQFPLWRDRRLSLVLRPFSLWMGFEPLSGASLRPLSLRVCFQVVLAKDESLRLSLALSSVLPCSHVMVTCPPPRRLLPV